MSVYALDSEDRASVQAIFDNLPKLQVMENLKKALDATTEKVCDEMLAYMENEYVLLFQEIVERQARKIVEELLRGENLATFGLKLQEAWNRPGDFFAYDGEGVRAALIRDFANEIQTAEMHELQKENARLQEQLKWSRV